MSNLIRYAGKVVGGASSSAFGYAALGGLALGGIAALRSTGLAAGSIPIDAVIGGVTLMASPLVAPRSPKLANGMRTLGGVAIGLYAARLLAKSYTSAPTLPAKFNGDPETDPIVMAAQRL